LAFCAAGSWQRHVQRWLSNCRIEIWPLYGCLILWALQHWQEPGERLLLALDTTMLWNRYSHCGRLRLGALQPSLSAEISIAMLEKADQLLLDFGAITLLADRGFPCDSWQRRAARLSSAKAAVVTRLLPRIAECATLEQGSAKCQSASRQSCRHQNR
jgi:hypothetical protein